MTDKLVIARRFRGPPETRNGGYVCGHIPAHFHGPAEPATVFAGDIPDSRNQGDGLQTAGE